MSKIGRAPLLIPSGVTLTQAAGVVTVTGPKGTLSYTLPTGITATLEGSTLTVLRASESKTHRALHGVSRAVLANLVTGVTEGFTKTLELVGTGYRARLQGTTLVLSLGFSHEIEFPTPAGLTLAVENTNIIKVSGIDRQQVGETAAKIRELRKPEPYKGKGIRYQGEIVRKKAGKAAKAAGSA